MLQQSESQRFMNILNSRATVTMQDCAEGTPLNLRISKAPFQGYWNPKLAMNQDIYNLDANKGNIITADWFKAQAKAAKELEDAGDIDGARKSFDDLLNKAQLSFSVNNPDFADALFAKGEIVKTVVDAVDVAVKDDQGNPTEETYKTIVVVGLPVAAAAKRAAKTTFAF